MIRDFPEFDSYWHIPSIKFGRRVMRNYNKLLAEYPGADGMKTGFICASGFNLVASATRGNRRLIAVVLGAPSGAVRTTKAASLLERGFNSSTLAWLLPSLGTVDALQPIKADPPDLRDQTCGPHRKRPAAEDEDDDAGASADNDQQRVMTLATTKDGTGASLLTGNPLAAVPPIVVYVGPKRAVAVATAADDAAIPVAKPRRKPKVVATDKPAAKNTAAAPTEAKPAAKTPKTAQAKAAKPKSAPHTQ
jgi:D-alanyl-D-alanine carboxypeptidase